jgi:hypothetical protein
MCLYSQCIPAHEEWFLNNPHSNSLTKLSGILISFPCLLVCHKALFNKNFTQTTHFSIDIVRFLFNIYIYIYNFINKEQLCKSEALTVIEYYFQGSETNLSDLLNLVAALHSIKQHNPKIYNTFHYNINF